MVLEYSTCATTHAAVLDWGILPLAIDILEGGRLQSQEFNRSISPLLIAQHIIRTAPLSSDSEQRQRSKKEISNKSLGVIPTSRLIVALLFYIPPHDISLIPFLLHR